MGPAIAAAAISGATQLLGNWMQYRQTKGLYDYQHSTNVRDWYRENAYNSPAQQMMRLKAAGLNPNLIYSSGNPVGNSGSIETGSMPNMPNNIAQAGSDFATAFMQDYRREQEIGNQESNIMSLIAYREFMNAYTQQNTEKVKEETTGKVLENEKKQTEREYWSESAYLDFLNLQENYKINQQKLKQLRAETALTWSQNRYTKQGVKNLVKQYDLNDSQIKSLEEGMRKMATERWQILFNAGMQKLNYQLSAAEKSAAIKQYIANVERLQSETAYLNTQADMRSFLASGRKRLTEELKGEHGAVSECVAQMLFSLYDVMANMPFSGVFK